MTRLEKAISGLESCIRLQLANGSLASSVWSSFVNAAKARISHKTLAGNALDDRNNSSRYSRFGFGLGQG